MPDDYEYDVFISYAEADEGWVEGYLIDALEHAGVRYHSEATFRLGVPLLPEFERAIKNSKRTLLILSPAYLSNEFSRFVDSLGAIYGLEMGFWPVIPLILHPIELPLHLKRLNPLKAMDRSEWEKVIENLCNDLQLPVPTKGLIPDCPYIGMKPFQTQDKDYFFGRDQEIETLVGKLRTYPFLSVIGPSGSGKSSLVFAGLIPALHKSQLFAEGKWLIRSLRPGATPLTSLISTLEGDLNQPELAVNNILNQHQAQHLLLIVDQFEEVFTQAEVEPSEFQNNLLKLIKIPNFYIVLTVRADFYPDLMQSPLWQKIQNNRYEVVPLDESGLRQAILKPAEKVEVFIESALLELLVTKAVGEPGVLPLLQETLVLLWQKVERRFLPLTAYDALVLAYRGKSGNSRLTGMQVAIATRADAAIADLSNEDQIIARRIFMRLIQFGEGRADTRRQQTVDALKAAKDPVQAFEKTLEHLANCRLLTLSGEPNKTRKVDIAHEALIAAWPQLQDWITQRKDAEQIRRRLVNKVEDWIHFKEQNGGLLDEVELADAERWLESPDAVELGYDHSLIELIRDSHAALEDEKRQAEEGQKRELRLTRKNLWTTRIALIFITGIALITGYQWREAEQGQIIAKVETAKTQFILNQNSFDHLISAIEAGKLLKKSIFNRNNAQLKADVLTVLAQGVHWSRERNRWQGSNNYIKSVSISPDGQVIATTGYDHNIILWDRTGHFIDKLEGHKEPVHNVSFSHDGKFLASASSDGTVKVWNVQDRHLINTILAHDDIVYSVSFSDDNQTLVSASKDKTIKLWNVRDISNPKIVPKPKITLTGHTNAVYSVSFKPNNPQILASASADGTVKLWENGQFKKNLIEKDLGLTSVSFSPDGQNLAAGSFDKTVKLWNLGKLNNTDSPNVLKGHSNAVLSVSFSPDSQTLASSSMDTTVKSWNLQGEEIDTIKAHQDRVNSISFSPQKDEKILVSVSNDKLIKIWQFSDIPVTILAGHSDKVNKVDFSPNGEMLASASDDTTVNLWDLKNYKPPISLLGYSSRVLSVRFSPDGQKIASASEDKTVRLWDIKNLLSPQILATGDVVRSVSFSPQGNLLATAGDNNKVLLWNLDNFNQQPEILAKHSNSIYNINFSKDGNSVASASEDGTGKIWKLNSQEEGLFTHNGSPIYNISWSPTEDLIATVSEDNTAKIWTGEGKKISTLIVGHEAGIWGVDFSPNGDYLATASEDKTVKYWARDGTLLITFLGHKDEVNDVSFSPDGNTLASASSDKTIVLWNLKDLTLDGFLRQGCSWLKDYLGTLEKQDRNRNLCQ